MKFYLHKTICRSKVDREDYFLYQNKLIRSFRDGKLHDLKGPAIRWENGNFEHFEKGIRHCSTGPAVRWSNGIEQFIIDGEVVEPFEGTYGRE